MVQSRCKSWRLSSLSEWRCHGRRHQPDRHYTFISPHADYLGARAVASAHVDDTEGIALALIATGRLLCLCWTIADPSRDAMRMGKDHGIPGAGASCWSQTRWQDDQGSKSPSVRSVIGRVIYGGLLLCKCRQSRASWVEARSIETFKKRDTK
jgi:hypothetical protein